MSGGGGNCPSPVGGRRVSEPSAAGRKAAPDAHAPRPFAPGPTLPAMPKVRRGLRLDPPGRFSSPVRRYGSVVRLRFLMWDALLIWRPDDVKHVLHDRHTNYSKQSADYRVLKRILGEGLVTSDGDLWLRQRRLMSPAFARKSIAAFGSLMVERTKAVLKSWEGPARDGRPIDVHHEMKRLSLDVVTRALFGIKVQEDARTVSRAFAILSEELAGNLYSPLFFFFLLPAIPTRTNLRARKALRTLDRIVGSIITRRRGQDPADDDDLL